MKKVKSLNGYSIFEAGPRDVDKYGYEAGSFYVFFSSDIRDFGIANSSPEYDGLDTLEAAEACCLGNYAKAREIVEGRTTAASFEEIVLRSRPHAATTSPASRSASTPHGRRRPG